MSSSDERNVRSPAANNVQQRACSRSSHEHHQAPEQRDDGTAATREVVPEGSVGAGKTGSPSPGGGQQDQPSVHRNDEAAALKEVVSEECTDVRNAGPPGPGGRRESKSNQANERVNQSQQATDAAKGKANLVASSMNITSSTVHESTTANRLEWGSSSTRTSSRRRTTIKNFAGEEQIDACEWKRRMGLICPKECTCTNSIPRSEEERVSKVRGMDAAADSWGVVANADIQDGEILTVFGGTTYVLGSTPEGKEFSKIQAKMAVEGTPLQYTFQGHLAEASTEQVWAIPEQDKELVRTRADVSL